jgi:hypothetical protein
MLSASATARVETWAQVRDRVGDVVAVAEISAIRALGAGRADVFPWRPAPEGQRQEVTLPVHGLKLALRFRRSGETTFYNGAVAEPGEAPWWTGWSQDGIQVLRDLARLTMQVLDARGDWDA